MISGTYVPSQHRLNVELPQIQDGQDGYTVGVERADGKDDPRFALFHQKEMSVGELRQFTKLGRNPKWKEESAEGVTREYQTANSDFILHLQLPRGGQLTPEVVQVHFAKNYG